VDMLADMVRNLVMLIFMTILLDLLLPASGFRRYLKMVFGLAVILVILTPISQAVDLIPDLGSSLRSNQILMDREMASARISKATADQRERIIQVYRDRIASEVKGFLERDGKWQVVDVEVQVVEDDGSNSFGQVTSMNAVVSPKMQGEENGERIEPIRIDPVEISPLDSVEENAAEVMAPELAGSLASYFMLEADRVEVRVITE